MPKLSLDARRNAGVGVWRAGQRDVPALIRFFAKRAIEHGAVIGHELMIDWQKMRMKATRRASRMKYSPCLTIAKMT